MRACVLFKHVPVALLQFATDGAAVCLQVFRGVHWTDDVFNHENVGFWHYLQPAYNIIGFISCAGTNFVIRSSAFAEAGRHCHLSLCTMSHVAFSRSLFYNLCAVHLGDAFKSYACINLHTTINQAPKASTDHKLKLSGCNSGTRYAPKTCQTYVASRVAPDVHQRRPELTVSLTGAAGYFPTHTLTEDYALGMEMRRKGWRGMFVEEELVRGTAPDKVRAAFGQRSRWCKVSVCICVCLCPPQAAQCCFWFTLTLLRTRCVH